MNIPLARSIVMTSALACVFTTAGPRPASANTASTIAIAAGAAAIVGGLIFDSTRHQYYYTRSNHRYYVDNNTATYYRGHGGRYQDSHGWHGNGYHGDNMRGNMHDDHGHR